MDFSYAALTLILQSLIVKPFFFAAHTGLEAELLNTRNMTSNKANMDATAYNLNTLLSFNDSASLQNGTESSILTAVDDFVSRYQVNKENT